jgi:hypothetical protein
MNNVRAVRMARRAGGALHFHDGEAQATLELPWPTPWTWLEELLCEIGSVSTTLALQP